MMAEVTAMAVMAAWIFPQTMGLQSSSGLEVTNGDYNRNAIAV